MSAELSATMIDCFTSSGTTAVENACESMYSIILDALDKGTAGEAKRQFTSFYELEDSLAGCLGLIERAKEDASAGPDAVAQIKAFYFGQMKAATDLLSDVARLEREREASQGWCRRSKHLRTCLIIVGANPGISGTELKKQMNLSNSGFSNFMKRIGSQRLFYVEKDGNTKYYMLTPRGRRFLQSQNSRTGIENREGVYEEKFILLLLEALASEMLESKPSASHVILQANRRRGEGGLVGNTQLLKRFIKQVFEARDEAKKISEIAIRYSYKSSWNNSYITSFDRYLVMEQTSYRGYTSFDKSAAQGGGELL